MASWTTPNPEPKAKGTSVALGGQVTQREALLADQGALGWPMVEMVSTEDGSLGALPALAITASEGEAESQIHMAWPVIQNLTSLRGFYGWKVLAHLSGLGSPKGPR